MTHQELIDYWQNQIDAHAIVVKLGKKYEREKHRLLLKQAQLFYMQLSQIETEEPKIVTGTKLEDIEQKPQVYISTDDVLKIQQGINEDRAKLPFYIADNILNDISKDVSKVKSKCMHPELVPCGKHQPFGLCADNENNGCHLQMRQKKAEIGLKFKYCGYNAVITDIYKNSLLLAEYENTDTNKKEYIAAAGFTDIDGRLIVNPSKFKSR